MNNEIHLQMNAQDRFYPGRQAYVHVLYTLGRVFLILPLEYVFLWCLFAMSVTTQKLNLWIHD